VISLAAIIVLTNLGYRVAYDTAASRPLWCAYELEPHEVVKAQRAAITFRADTRLGGADKRVSFDGYDRGHLAPAADFNWSTNALRETYLLSNIVPMHPRVNRGAWARTEDEVRRLAASGTVNVVIWPEYSSGQIPSAFHKVAYGWFGLRHWHFNNLAVVRECNLTDWPCSEGKHGGETGQHRGNL